MIKFIQVENGMAILKWDKLDDAVALKKFIDEGVKVDMVLTMGSGSTGIVCQNTNRKFIGIEKEKNIMK